MNLREQTCLSHTFSFIFFDSSAPNFCFLSFGFLLRLNKNINVRNFFLKTYLGVSWTITEPSDILSIKLAFIFVGSLPEFEKTTVFRRYFPKNSKNFPNFTELSLNFCLKFCAHNLWAISPK